MAQTGDVKHGIQKIALILDWLVLGSDLPDLRAEFNDIPHERAFYLWRDRKIRWCK